MATKKQAPIILRIQRAVDDLLDATSLSASELARRMGTSQPAVTQAKARGANISLSYLQAIVGAAGYVLELRVRSKTKGKPKAP